MIDQDKMFLSSICVSGVSCGFVREKGFVWFGEREKFGD